MLPGLLASLVLSALLAAGETPADVPGPRIPSRDRLDGAVDQILSRPEYRSAMRGSGEPLDLVAWIRQQLAQLGGLRETSVTAFWAIIIIGIVVLVLLLGHITYTLVRTLRPRLARTRADAPTESRPRSPDELMLEANALAEASDFRGAIRALYLALVQGLQMHGALPRTRGQTNREHVRHLAQNPALLRHVEPFAGMFDEKWYGGRSADAEDFSRCRGWLEGALQEVEVT